MTSAPRDSGQPSRHRSLPSDFASILIRWQSIAGRHDLPWVGTRDPYRVWLSEVMLQQTQVVTVRQRYLQFLRRFPSLESLAGAEIDDVLTLWQGMGYYTRARNLHRCAQRIVSELGGVFPSSAAALVKLPGIGPSSAAAIAAFCFGERVSIFDGNVQRVLARLCGFEADLSGSAALKDLRSIADAGAAQVTNSSDMSAYTQGLMDWGATICLPKNPRCELCPYITVCAARQMGQVGRIPIKSKKVARRSLVWEVGVHLRTHRGGWQVLLYKRPTEGIWGGLYAPPVKEIQSADAISSAPLQGKPPTLPTIKHVLTHRDLYLQPVLRVVDEQKSSGGIWIDLKALASVALPVPIAQLLRQVSQLLLRSPAELPLS